ncbi:MAG: penicillin acylase family protein, partial [Candidatus Acidiferrales bacterium]
PKGNGLLPVPGTGGYEWKGFIPFAELPRQFNPDRGFVATANDKTIPDHFPYAAGFVWSTDRIARIEQVLNEARTRKQPLDRDDMARLQNDVVSLPAKGLLKLVQWPEKTHDAAAKLLVGWDGDLREDSAAAALYEVWLKKLRDVLNEILIANRGGARVLIDTYIVPPVFLRAPPEIFGEDAKGRRDAILEAALHTAYAELQEQFGPDPARWSWGRLHTVRFRHSLDKIQNLENLFDLGPWARPGDDTTVDATDYPREGFSQTDGASYREIFDLSDWDQSEAVNAPGQSGQPGSRHYDDLLPFWREGKYFQLVYSRNSVEKQMTERLTLLPARQHEAVRHLN